MILNNVVVEYISLQFSDCRTSKYVCTLFTKLRNGVSGLGSKYGFDCWFMRSRVVIRDAILVFGECHHHYLSPYGACDASCGWPLLLGLAHLCLRGTLLHGFTGIVIDRKSLPFLSVLTVSSTSTKNDRKTSKIFGDKI